MADTNEFASRPTQVSKDVQGSDNSIPLSPQWLLPKPGENKTGTVSGENHFSTPLGHANRPDTMKPTGTGEYSNENPKKKDVFRPSVLDMESGRRDRWRDEERDTNSSVCKDRWKEGEREHNVNRKVDRWTDTSGKNQGEARRAPGERWTTDTGNKDSHEQRRDSKWNTRWGPGDKEADAVHEKWGDSNKEDDGLLEKVPFYLPHNGKDEKDGDHYRPWRSNSSHGRGRGDVHHQSLTLNKQLPTFSHSQGRGENHIAVGRGKVGSIGTSFTQTGMNLQPHGSVVEKGEGGREDSYLLKYNRTKLIDIYRTADTRSHAKHLEGFVEVSLLTQENPIEPLACCAPTPEELVILKRIDKGEILSSGAPQISKDGSVGRTTTESIPSRQGMLGSKVDLPDSQDDSRHEIMDNPKQPAQVHEPFSGFKLNAEVSNKGSAIHRKTDDVSGARESSAGPWRPSSFAERARSTSHDWENNVDSPNTTTRKVSRWQMGDDPNIGKQPSMVFDREMDTQKISQPAPEDLVLFYKDPHGEIQGPFAGIDIISWFESGYFGIDLQVRLASAPSDSPFCVLGDVMPHLRAKARPPPGFTTPKPTEIEASGRLEYSNFGKPYAVSSETDMLKNDPGYKHGSGTEAQNRYLESLMAGRLSAASLDNFSLSEGMQGYGGNIASAQPPLGFNSGGDLYLLAKKMNLERQRSLSNPYANIMSSVPENAQAQQQSQNVDLLSVLQCLPDRSTSNVTNGMSSWLNFPVQGDPLQDKLDIHHNQNFVPQSAFGMQQQRVQPQNPPVTNVLPQSNILTPENILASGLSQDPQILSLLQQQYLLQLQSQNPVPSPQMSLLDKLLLLKQQQKQEEQQQLMRQQQLLSQVLSEHHHNQQLSGPPFSQPQTGGFIPGNANVDHACLQSHDLFQLGLQQVSTTRDENANVSAFVLPPVVSQDVSSNIGSDTSTQLPHQFFANNMKQQNLDASQMEQVVNKQQKSSSMLTDGIDVQSVSEKANRYPFEQVSSYHDESVEGDVASRFPVGDNMWQSMSEKLIETRVTEFEEPQDVGEQHIGVSSSIKEVKNIELQEVKISPEKKLKKQKFSKVTTNTVTGISKSHQSISSEAGPAKPDMLAVKGDALACSVPVTVTEKEKMKDQQAAQVAYASQVNPQTQARQWAWKPAPGFRPKSLLEIQQEEQRRAQEEMAISEISTSVSSMSLSTPWGEVGNADLKGFTETQSYKNTELNFAKSDISSVLKSKKSQEDLFWDSNVAQIGQKEVEISSSAPGVPFASFMSSKIDSVADDDFIEAKDTKKSRKKSNKAKNAESKVAPVSVVDTSVGSSPIDKFKHTKQMQQEKEVLPAVPSGASLGDFVFWKDETPSPSPAPVWSIDSGKPRKATSLRDIVKEQEKKMSSSSQAVPVPAPQKPATSQPVRGSGSSWSLSSSPAKAASPIQTNSQASSHPKHKVEDDLFWGPLEQPKPEAKKLDFPQLGTQDSWGSKSTPMRGTPPNKLKSIDSRPTEYTLSAFTQSSQKGKKKTLTKQSEATDFKEWCENECIKLVGSKDTSFLEYCLKQSRVEAKMLLIENLGSFDPGHEFIDKFLNYKDFLPSDVLEIAFNNNGDRKSFASKDAISAKVDVGGSGLGSVGVVGKKKGKKGKKVSSSVLGFNVVSNRIMMGEIQTVDD